MSSKLKFLPLALLALPLLFQSCKCAYTKEGIKMDGSSTVYVISEAIAEEYKKLDKGNVSIGVSGTGGGFKKLCSNRIDLIGASRAITDSEKELCKKNSVNYLELPVAYDGIVIVVNKSNDWLNQISVSMLKKIFEPEAEGKIMKWKDLDPSWPDRKFEMFAPGVASGTYDYFTKAVVGKEHSSRGDMTTSEDDNVLVHGVRSTPDGIGFFSYAYYRENMKDLKALAVVDDTAGKSNGVMPTTDTIQNGSYSPLSRLIFVYANSKANDSSKKFLEFYLQNSKKIAHDVGFIPLTDELHQKAMSTLKGK